MEEQSPPPPRDQVWHTAFHEEASETVILLHGLGTSHLEWTAVWPLLSTYHVLAPDMPGHSNSAHMTAVDIPSQTERIATLIQEHAHNGKAHVAGLSMGGFVALETARLYPELVRSAFVSGCAPFTGWRQLIASNAAVVGAASAAFNHLPRWLVNSVNGASWKWQGLTVSEELQEEIRRNNSSTLLKDVFASISTIHLDNLSDVRVRTLAVAGGRMDDVEGTRSQGSALRHSSPSSSAAVVKDAQHPWNLQFPELFAQGIMCWIEQRPLPVDFALLRENMR